MREDRAIKLQRYDFASKHRRFVPSSRRNTYIRIAAVLAVILALLALKKMAGPPDPGFPPTQGKPSPGAVSAAAAGLGADATDAGTTGPETGGGKRAANVGGEFSDLESPFKNYPAADTFAFGNKTLVAEYSGDSLLTARTELYLRRYRPETGVMLVCDLKSGRVLSLGERRDTLVSRSPRLAFAGGFPAASLVKILTAAAALELGGKDVTDSIPQLGSYHTLYKRQLKAGAMEGLPKITLQEAFAKSVNPAFGLLGMTLGADALRKYAARMGFNSSAQPACLSPSLIAFPDTGFSLAETACGFTAKTTISPWHALEIARGAGDDGRMRNCTFVTGVRDLKTGTLLPHYKGAGTTFVSKENLLKLQSLMEGTVKFGTARKGFHSVLRASHMEKLVLGGKTGSLDGVEPKGRYDWFIGYARLKDDPAQGIALCIMLVHLEYQSVRSSQLAALLIRDWLAALEKARKAQIAIQAA